MDMREKIARALALDEYDGGYLSGAEVEACVEEDMRTSRREVLLRKADRVLDAMREPTEGMLKAGAGWIMNSSLPMPGDNEDSLRDAWPEMIDAARAGK